MARTITYKAGAPGVERELTVEIHEADAAPWGLDASLRLVGGAHPRPDGPAKATGAARYTYDVARPRTAVAGSLLSPYAHARLTSADEAAARAVPGVLDVRVQAGKELRHAGEACAVVVAETERALQDGLRALQAVFQPLPAAVTTDDAMRPGAPTVEGTSNVVIDERRGRQGNAEAVAKALADADIVVEAEFRTQVQTHSALEPHGSLSDPGGADGEPTVWASTQATSSFRGLGRPLSGQDRPARVIVEHMGGGFGAKFGPMPGDQAAADAARRLQRPVRYMCTRREEHLIGGNRPDSIQRLKLGGTKDGQITAFLAETFGTAGNGTGGAGANNTMVYRLGASAGTQAAVRTFTARGAAFRAPGHPQGSFALEGMIDLYAHKAGLDPLEVRRKNDRHALRALQWQLGAEKIGWAQQRRRKAGSDKGPIQRGVGCAAARWGTPGGGKWNVEVRVESNGSVQVRNGAQDLGTGMKSVLQLIVAEELGCDLARVSVALGDTRFPDGPGSGGSTTTPSLAPAAREAGLRAREQLEALLGLEWKTDPDQVRLEQGVFRGPGGKKASFAEACGLIGEQGLTAVGQRRENWRAADGLGETAGCQFAQVAVDVETGVVRVERIVAVHDCGRVINSLTSRSQVSGGVIQGVSYALFEEKLLDRAQGDMVNPTFDTYRIAGMQDCPQIDVVLTSVVSGFNNVGAMGLGEPATVPTAAAIAGAVFHAIGVQVRELPMTPARVLAALARKDS